MLNLDDTATLVTADARYWELAKAAHPDVGGTHEAMAALNQAIQDARKEFEP